MDITVIRIIIVAVSASFFSFILFVINYALKQKRMRDKALEKLGSPSGTGMLNSVEYRYRYYPGSKNSPSSFRVEIDAPSERSFKVTREGGFDRLSKHFGISAEAQTGDREFDENFYITTDDNEFIQTFFSPSAKRQAVRNIFNTGFNRVEHDGKRMMAICTPFKIDKEIDQSVLTHLVSNLISLGRQMPHMSQSPVWQNQSPIWKTNRIMVFSIAVLVSVIGTIALVIGMSKYSPFDKLAVFLDSLKWSIPAFVAYAGLAVYLLKGRSSSHRELLIAVPISLTGMILGGWGGEMVLNGYLDESGVANHRARVLWKTESTSDNSTTYYAHVESWRGSGTKKIRISHAEYLAIRENQTHLALDTRSGRLGFEWLEKYRLDNGDTSKSHKRTMPNLADSGR
jgi:hypothetical protein